VASRQPIILTDELLLPPALIRAGLDALPSIIRAQGERASRRFIEFFTANIRNRNTRMAYARAVKQFFDWCDKRKLELREIEPLNVAAYIEQLGAEASKPTVKSRHPEAIRLPDDRRDSGLQPSKFRARAQVRGQARQDPGVLGRGSSQAAGLYRREYVDRSPRPGAHRGHGLQFRQGGRDGDDAGGRLFPTPEALMAPAP